MRKFIIICGILSVLFEIHGQNVFNDNFDEGLKNWRVIPAEAASVRIEKSEDGRSLLAVAPRDANVELNSCTIKTGKDLNTAGTYKITYELNVASVSAGSFNLSLIFNNGKDQPLKQHAFSIFTAGQKTENWEKYSFKFGANSECPFPDGTASVTINICFREASGKSSGKVMLGNVEISHVMPSTPVLPDIRKTDAGQIPVRFEDPAEKDYYWIEAENFAPDDAVYGSLKYRNAWTSTKVGIPNESNMHSLVRPLAGNEAEASAFIRISRSSYYNLWVRMGSLSQWGPQRISVEVNGQKFTAAPPPDDQLLNDAFTWVKLNPEPFKLRRTRPVVLKIRNDIEPRNPAFVDCFLLTEDLKYVPSKQIPCQRYYTVLPYTGPLVEADIWSAARLETPVYICKDSAQQFLMQIRNLSGKPQKNVCITITLPEGVTMDSPVPRPDSKPMKNHPLEIPPPSNFEHKVISEFGKNLNQYSLTCDKDIAPFDLNHKTDSLMFLVLNADSKIVPGSYNIKIRCTTPDGHQQIVGIVQQLEVLQELKSAYSKDYDWGVDTIYSSLLNPEQQKKILDTFEKAGMTIWAARPGEAVPDLVARNREHWKLLSDRKHLRLVGWGEWWWPGNPYTDESREYLHNHPDSAGIWRNDPLGKSLENKLICPEYLIRGQSETYIRNPIEKLIPLLREHGIKEYLEDAEYSSPLSFCFCSRCKQAFASHSGIPYATIKDMDADKLVSTYKNRWVDFRCMQNTELLDRITTMARQIYPEINFNLSSGYPSASSSKQRSGIDWEQLVKLKNLNGVYVADELSGSAARIVQMAEWTKSNQKTFSTMAKGTLSLPDNPEEIDSRNQAGLEARIIHDIMCGAGGILVWWWGTFDGRCMKAFETGTRIGADYGDILRQGILARKKAGITEDFYLLTAENGRGKLVCLVNTSFVCEDIVLSPENVLKELPEKTIILNVLSGKTETREDIRKRLETSYKRGNTSIWFFTKK